MRIACRCASTTPGAAFRRNGWDRSSRISSPRNVEALGWVWRFRRRSSNNSEARSRLQAKLAKERRSCWSSHEPQRDRCSSRDEKMDRGGQQMFRKLVKEIEIEVDGIGY